MAYFELANGSRGLVDSHGPTVDPASLRVVGTSGMITTSREWGVTLQNANGYFSENYAKTPGPGWETLGLPPARNSWLSLWDCLLADLIRWLDGGAEPELALRKILPTSELNLAAYLSALHGDRIDLPLSPELLLHDEWPVEAIARRSKPN